MANKKEYRAPDVPTVEELNLPGGFFNPAYNAKLADARRDGGAVARRDRAARCLTVGEVLNAERGTLKAENARLLALLNRVMDTSFLSDTLSHDIRAAIAAKNDPDCPGGTECECDKG
jgi:hypothetical protein